MHACIGEGNGNPLHHSFFFFFFSAPLFLHGESQGQGSLVDCHLWGCTESDTTEATQQQQPLHVGEYNKGEYSKARIYWFIKPCSKEEQNDPSSGSIYCSLLFFGEIRKSSVKNLVIDQGIKIHILYFNYKNTYSLYVGI